MESKERRNGGGGGAAEQEEEEEGRWVDGREAGLGRKSNTEQGEPLVFRRLEEVARPTCGISISYLTFHFPVLL